MEGQPLSGADVILAVLKASPKYFLAAGIAALCVANLPLGWREWLCYERPLGPYRGWLSAGGIALLVFGGACGGWEQPGPIHA